jgi:hypothetical protein
VEPSTNSPSSYGTPARGVRQSDVSHAADTLLRAGNRPTVEKIRTTLGRGSPNTINPMLDGWWKTLSARLDSGPAALHRLPESIAHIAEALWMQALEEGKRRAALEQRDSARVAELDKQRMDLRSHVLTLREGELDSRLRDRDRSIEELNLRLREFVGALRKEQTTNEFLVQQIAKMQPARKPANKGARRVRARKEPTASRLKATPAKRVASKQSARKRKIRPR